MHTAVNVKMDAFDDLLLSGGVHHQLGSVEYHPQVDAGKPNHNSEAESLHLHSEFGSNWYNL